MVMALVLLGALASASAKDLAAMSTNEIRGLQQRLTEAKCYTGPIDGRPSSNTEDAKKACPEQEPILRIETKSHTARVNEIAVLGACDAIISASTDKTIRIWSSGDGQLQKTIRLPVGADIFGGITTLAISPDQTLLAIGGYDPYAKNNKGFGVYIYGLRDGLIRRLGNVDDVVHSLAFSPDGTRIAVGSVGKGGFYVFDELSGDRIYSDKSYSNTIDSIIYNRNGDVITASEDTFVRLYDENFKLHAKYKSPKGTKPLFMAINPSKDVVSLLVNSINFGESINNYIIYLDSKSLKSTGESTYSGKFGELFGGFAWSSDGRVLYAAGMKIQNSETVTFVRRLAGGQKPIGDDTLAGDVTDLKPCGTGVAFGAGTGRFGLIDENGVAKALGESASIDMFRARANKMMTNLSGEKVFLPPSQENETSLEFSPSDGLRVGVVRDAVNLHEAVSNGISIGQSATSSTANVNGNAVNIDTGEFVFSSVSAANGLGFSLGTTAGIRYYDAKGTMIWKVLGSGTVWGLNISADNKVIVAALGDGTIRWYRAKDGVELLALFVEKLSQKWVAWTPTGYYMASPGGEDLIGWHVNRGWEQEADFFPASRFRDRFNRPDIVQKVLTTLDEDQAVVEANGEAHRDATEAKPVEEQLPPVLRITSPREGTAVSGDSVILDYVLRSPSGLPVDAIDVIIDGRPVSKNRGVERVDEASQAACPGLVTRGVTRSDASSPTEEVVCHLTVPLSAPSQTFEIGLIARSGSLASVPALVKLTFSSGGGPSEARKPKLYVLSIGVSDYADPKLKLGFPARDAEDFAKVMTGQSGGLYEGVEAKVLTNGEASRANVMNGLDWLSQTVTSHDVAMVFMAGHGVTESSGSFYYLPSDANEEQQHLGGVSQGDIKRMLAALPSKVLFFLDACHSGQAASQVDRRGSIDVNSLVNDLSASENGIVSFASSTGRELSEESSDWGHGAFTVALIEGIGEGKAGLLKNGTITLSELDAYVANRVTTLTSGRQHPVMNKPATITNFPIAEIGATPAALMTQPVVSQERPAPAATPSPVAASASDDTDAKADFMIAKEINTIGGWSTFLRKYPSGFYSDLAREARAKLETQGSSSQPPSAASSSNATVAASSASAQSVAVTDCDRLASSPYDPSRPAGIAGKELYDIRPEAVDACRAAVAQDPDDPRVQYQLGRALMMQRHFDEAMSLLQKGADKNFAPSKMAIGVLYTVGYGVKQDDRIAMEWFIKAAEQDDSEAERNIGLSYDYGNVVQKDKQKAISWFLRAANHGNRDAQDRLGQHYEHGDGVSQDYQNALFWYNKSVENGWPGAQQHLAAMYDNGRGVERDPQKAAELLLDAVKKGSASVAEQLVKSSSAWKVETRRAIQQILSDEGRYTGRIDGAFGQGTLKEIIKLYQESQE